MTVEVQEPSISHVGNGTTAPLAVPFRFLRPADLRVTQISATGAETELVRGTHYTVAGAGASEGGSVTPVLPIATSLSWRIERATPLEQPTQYSDGFYSAASQEMGLDRQMLALQEVSGQAKRALKVPPGQAGLLVDLRDAEGKILQLFGGKIRGVPYYVPPGGSGTGAEYNVQDYGAKGIGTDHDDTPGFQKAIDAAWYAGGGTIVIPATPTGYNLAGPNIPYPGDPDSYVKRAVLKLRPNVSIRGVGMPRVRISGGRDNPPGMLFQAWWENDRIDNIEICGVWWDADCYSEAGPRNGNSYDGGAGAAEGDIYQFQHAIAIWAGSNIRIHGNKFSGYRGSGVFLGNVFNATLNEYLCDNAHVHNNEFVDMFRDAVFSASVTSGSAYHNWCHGDGYWVAVFDVERHSGNETLTGFKVYQNFIDGSDGERPIELGRPGTKLLRAGSIAFFYDGYPNDEVDGKFRGIEFTDNLIYRGVIDLWSATDSAINGNVIINDTAEDIPNNNLITSAAISVRYFSGGEGVRKVEVKGNKILHRVRNTAPYKTSHGIWCVGYRDMEVSGNFVEGAELDGIRMDYCTGLVERNRIRDCGTVADRRAGIVASASQDQIIVRDNIIEDSRAGDARTIEHAVSLDGAFPRWPVITENIGANIHGTLINGEALGFCHGNMDYSATWRTNRAAEIGGALRVAGETSIGDSINDIAIVLKAGGAKKAQMVFSQNGEIEFIQAQLADGTFIEQNFAEGTFQRNVRLIHPDGTYQLGLQWDTPLASMTGDYLWFSGGTFYKRTGSKPTGPTDGTVILGGGSGGGDDDDGSIDALLASRTLSSGNFSARAAAVSSLPVGAYFTSDEAGEMRQYKRTTGGGGFVDEGDENAPVMRNLLNSTVNSINDAAYPAWADPLTAIHMDWLADRYWQIAPARQFRSFARLLDYGVSETERATSAALDGATLSIVAPDEIRRDSGGAVIERASENLLPYHDWAGAIIGVVGSGGAFPTGWEPNFAVTREIVGTGTDGGRRWISIRLARTGGAPSAANVNVRTLNAAKIASPGALVASGQIEVISLSGVATGVQVNVNEFTSDGVTSVGTTTGRLYVVADGRSSYATWRNVVAANMVTQNFNVACSSATGDFEAVFKIWSPQLEAGEDAQDFTSTMSDADGSNPRAADEVHLLAADGDYEVLTRGDNYDLWASVTASDEVLTLPIGRRNRKIHEHRGYLSSRLTHAQKQAISDERVAILSSIGTTNQNFSDREFWVQSAAQPWSLCRATNKHERYVIECRSGYYWSGDTGMDRVRTEFQCNYKEAYDTDVWVAYNLRMSSPTGITSTSLVLGQFHATEDVGDFAGYPVFELNYHPDGLYIYTASVANASQPLPYDRVERAAAVPFALDDWHSVVIRIRFNWEDDAVLQFWLDGQLIVDVSGVSIGHNDAVGPYWKHGVYFRFETEDQTVIAEYANFRIGNASLADRVSNPPVAS